MSIDAGPANADLAYAGNAASRYGHLTHAGNADSAYDGAAAPPAAAAPGPVIEAVVPASGSRWGDVQVSVSGTGFGGATAVAIGLPAASFTVVSGTLIIAWTDAGQPGPADVSVTTPAGTGTLPGGFTYEPESSRRKP
jgi:IPT/TIG domain